MIFICRLRSKLFSFADCSQDNFDLQTAVKIVFYLQTAVKIIFIFRLQSKLFLFADCGQRAKWRQLVKIVNGQRSQPDEWPWAAALVCHDDADEGDEEEDDLHNSRHFYGETISLR